jgi:hypothetical protein
MNPTGNENPMPEQTTGGESELKGQVGQALRPPVIGYCRATGKALSAEEATYVDGVLYAKEYAETMKTATAVESPYGAPAAAPKASDVSPGWAFVLGLIPGVGAIYNQQYGKGMLHIIVFAALATLMDRPMTSGAFLGLLMMGWFFYMPFEAFHTAQRRQRGEAPDEMSGLIEMPGGLKKLPIAPLLLIGTGVVFLLDNLGILRIEEIYRYWPLLMIGAGILLLVKQLEDIVRARQGQSHAD